MLPAAGSKFGETIRPTSQYHRVHGRQNWLYKAYNMQCIRPLQVYITNKITDKQGLLISNSRTILVINNREVNWENQI